MWHRGLRYLALVGLGSALGCVEAAEKDQSEEIEQVTSAISGANLGGMNLGGMNLGGMNLAGMNLGGMNLGGTNLGGMNLAGMNLSGTNLGGMNLGGMNLSGTNLAGMNLAGMNLAGMNLAGMNLAASNLGGSTSGTKKSGAGIVGTRLGSSHLGAPDTGRNIHSRTPLPQGMLYSGEDLWTPKSDQCIVMGLGSTAFGKLLAQQSPNARISIALGKHRWGFATTASGPVTLNAWEAIVWGDKTYCVFMVAAPPASTWPGVAGFIKAIFRWQAPITQTMDISGIEASVGFDPTVRFAIDTYTGMMDSAAHLRAGRINDKSMVAGELAFVTATTNNQSVQVDFSSWVMDSSKMGLVLGNVQAVNPPTFAESVYVALENSDGSVAITIANADGLRFPSQHVAESNQDLLGAYFAYLRGEATKPVARRCGGALYLAFYFAAAGETVPIGQCDSGLSWLAWSTARDYRTWSSLAGTTAPMNQYMALPADATHPVQRSEDGQNWKPVLSETYVHMWERNYDIVGPIALDDKSSGASIDTFNFSYGIWNSCSSCSGYYKNTHHWSNTKDNKVTVFFIGTNIKFYGAKDKTYGIGAVSMDGGPETMIDFYAPVAAGNQLLWSSPTLTGGAHTFKLRVTGTKNAASSNTTVSVDHADVW